MKTPVAHIIAAAFSALVTYGCIGTGPSASVENGLPDANAVTTKYATTAAANTASVRA